MSINPLSWKIEKRPLFDKEGNELPIFGTFRSDNNNFLGAVTGRYNIIQNEELFKLGDSLTKEDRAIKLISSGEINGGQQVFVKFSLPSVIDILKKGDIVNTELMISTKHDGTGSLIPRVMIKRLICLNGATVPINTVVSSIRHSISADEKLEEMRELLSNVSDEIKVFGNVSNQLAKVALPKEEVGEIIQAVYYKDELNNLLTSAQKQNQARNVLSIYDNNDNNKIPEIKDTAWALYNAFTRFVDHSMNFRIGGNENDEQAKLRGILFGAGESLKMKAFFDIVRIVKKNHSIEVPEYYLTGAKSE